MGIMSGATGVLSKPTKKYVLQPSNCNLEKEEDPKQMDRNIFLMRNNEEMFETENQFSPHKKASDRSIQSDAKKLRSIRLDLSSLNRGVIQKAGDDLMGSSSDESSEDDVKKKQQHQRKQRPVVPNYVTNTDSGPCRKPRQSRQDPLVISSQNSPKLAKSQTLSIARRNARERNRVKQVNEGFTTLRSRIPEYISDAYNEEKGRKNVKKLSKVETLRMAVDYIRHLETLLGLKATERDVWVKEVKNENRPWDTPTSSADYPSPVESKYQPSSVESPVTPYEQTFEYQDRIFYEYDLDFIPKKDDLSPERQRAPTFGVLAPIGNDNENECVDDFKYYETFNRLKKENGDSINMKTADVDEEGEEEEEEDLENLDRDSEIHSLPKPKDVIPKVPNKGTVLPSITESFSKGIPVFF